MFMKQSAKSFFFNIFLLRNMSTFSPVRLPLNVSIPLLKYSDVLLQAQEINNLSQSYASDSLLVKSRVRH